MEPQNARFLWTSIAAAVLLPCLLSFNVDQKTGLSFSGPLDDMFGYSVQQFENAEGKWVLIGSPHSGQPTNRTGDVYKCPVGGGEHGCIKLELPRNTTVPSLREVKENMTMGTTLVTDGRGGFLACGPQYGYKCGQQLYVSGVCANVSSSFEVLDSMVPAEEKCAKLLDIVIVLDGSNSIYPWTSILDFLLKFLKNIEIGPQLSQVGIVSYGENVTHRVNLSQFDNRESLLKKVQDLPQDTGVKTMTAAGIETARKEAFMEERGARPGAKKVMVIVTDGESHDSHDLKRVVQECEEDGIERFGIAVLGDYNRQKKSPAEIHKFINEIQSISSSPLGDHFFNVSDEVALLTIVDALGSRIFALEATSGNFTSSFGKEMSQAGFSAHTSADGVLLGAVGAYDWNGTVVMHMAHRTVIPENLQFFDAETEEGYEGLAGYLGYDVQSASTPQGRLYIAGAPRYNHTGRVVIYRLDSRDRVEVVQILKGEQIGSYFGSVLQTVDVDQDSFTDLLLVGAPMFMGPERAEQGLVYVYQLQQSGLFEHHFTLKPVNQSCCHAHSDGCAKKNEPCGARFGTAIAAVLDLNLDGFNDVAVGAPLENDHRGAVYLYHGDHRRGLREAYVQRIPAGGDGDKVKFFGQSIHGVMDLNGDGLTDVTIGGLGGAALFWSRDVGELRATMTFNPWKINLQQTNCELQGRSTVCVSALLCFAYAIKSDAKAPPQATDIRYTLTLDALRAKARAAFSGPTDKSEPRVSRNSTVTGTLCVTERFGMSARPDFRDPITVSLEFGLANKDEGPVLDANLPTSINQTIPVVDCGANEKCVADLSLEARPSVQHMVIKAHKEKITVFVDVKNTKDNAYNTKVIVQFSRNINYVKVEPEKKDCTLNQTRLECAVGYPFLASNAEEQFKLKFEVSPEHIAPEIQINVTATSDSDESPSTLGDNVVRILLPVKYEAALIFSVKPKDEHMVVKEGEQHPVVFNSTRLIGRELNVSYTVEKSLKVATPPLKLTITYPHRSPMNNILLYLTHVSAGPHVACNAADLIDPLRISPERPHTPKTARESLSTYLVSCGSAACASFDCMISEAAWSQVNLTFRVWKPTFIQAEFPSLFLTVNGSLTSRDALFLLTGDNNARDVKLQVSKEATGGIPWWIILISILMGLLILALVIFALWKMNFFKRKTMEERKEDLMD